jgi:Flp pilus assembly protein TadG
MNARPATRSSRIRRSKKSARRGNIIVLSAFLMTSMVGMLALSVDAGYTLVVKTQLQVAADSAAMAAASVMGSTTSDPVATAKTYAGYHTAGGKTVTLQSSDIEYGTWDTTLRTFTPASTVGNAIRVTARRNSTTGGNSLFFGRIFGMSTFSTQAQAVAMGNTRDICFVVDLSGSMNRDTWTDYGGSPSYRSSGYTSIYQSMMQTIFTNLNFGTYPGTTQTVGQPVGATKWSNLYSKTGPLSSNSIPATYRILSTDSSSTRQTKAYKWMIDNQIASIMPNAKPTPNSSNSASYTYWQSYLSTIAGNSSYVIGYRTYLSWCLDGGRDQTVDSNNDYGQISINSPNCVYHNESTAGGTFSFPADEQPTHSERRSVIAGLQEVKTRNALISDSTQKDWVSIVSFDKTGGTVTRLALTSNYDTAMQTATTLQAVGYNGASTNTESGLAQAYALIKPASQGGTGRENTQKVVILLTDGVANLKDSSNSTVSSYESAHPSTYSGSSNYYGSSDYYSDAAMMQTNTMQGQGWKVYALGIGLAVDTDFMNRMARVGGTADDSGNAPTTSGDPSTYETEMTALLDQIIDNPQVRLVK